MTLTAGDRLGPYEILAPIGKGGMGEVWKARDTRLNRLVAIKQIKGEHSARFEQEARAIAALNHPHILRAGGGAQAGNSASRPEAGQRAGDRIGSKAAGLWTGQAGREL